jgi:menaquinone-dependent protoporphyrinogen oxidase
VAGVRILVSTASKHGSTAEIGHEIAGILAEAGHDVEDISPDGVKSLAGFDAVVLGSGIYVGHWLAPARDLVERLADELVERPVWLFSTGPIGDPPKPDEDPEEIGELLEITHAREHVTFAGKVDRSELGLGEKVIVAAVRLPEGDFRPWADVRAWATGIAEALRA